MEPNFEQITAQARTAVTELLDAAGLNAGDIFVVGCSSSEVLGGHIGKASSREAAEAMFNGIYPVLRERGIYLAAQCCEHLNRALIIEAECAEKYGYEPVCVVPQPKAGGSFATQAAPSSGCTCGRWRCPCGSVWTTSGRPSCCAPAPAPSSSAEAGRCTNKMGGEMSAGKPVKRICAGLLAHA